jgi:hypothetical protein
MEGLRDCPPIVLGTRDRASLIVVLVDIVLLICRRSGRRAVRATTMTEMQISAVAQISKIC